MKGAAEVVLERCSRVLQDGGAKPLTEDDKKRILSINDEMANQALRVLAVAYRAISADEDLSSDERIERDFTFIGLVGMLDPPREDALAAVEASKKVHIKPIMITGDHKLTAVAIAKEMGIYNEGDVVLTGRELEDISDEELERIVDRVSVYARVSPLDKLKIVRAWKRREKVVAMTGDGVNDAPALKQADIGVAMGITGTEVSKEAADMVLSDDNFATIVKAIELGRWIYDNIKKFLVYLLKSNIVEVAVMTTLVLLGFPLPLLPVHLLYINLATDGLPAIALGLAPPDPDLMRRPPRGAREPVFSREVKFLIGFITVLHTPLFVWLFLSNIHRGIDVARTMLFLSFIVVELSLALNLRSLRYSITKVLPHKWLLAAVLWEIALLTIILGLDGLRAAFKLVVPSAWDMATIAFVAAIPFIEFELIKHVVPRLLIPESELALIKQVPPYPMDCRERSE